MTIIQAVAVKDDKIESFNAPFFAPTLGAASRAFIDGVKSQDADNIMSKHPQDFALYHVGTYDQSTGHFTPISPPTLICEAISAFDQPVNNGRPLQ